MRKPYSNLLKITPISIREAQIESLNTWALHVTHLWSQAVSCESLALGALPREQSPIQPRPKLSDALAHFPLCALCDTNDYLLCTYQGTDTWGERRSIRHH